MEFHPPSSTTSVTCVVAEGRMGPPPPPHLGTLLSGTGSGPVAALTGSLQGLGLSRDPLAYPAASSLSIPSPIRTKTQGVLCMLCSRKSMYDFLLLSLLQRMPDVQVCPAILTLQLMNLLELSFWGFHSGLPPRSPSSIASVSYSFLTQIFNEQPSVPYIVTSFKEDPRM